MPQQPLALSPCLRIPPSVLELAASDLPSFVTDAGETPALGRARELLQVGSGRLPRSCPARR